MRQGLKRTLAMSRAKTSVLSYDGRRGSSIGYLSWRPSLSVLRLTSSLPWPSMPPRVGTNASIAQDDPLIPPHSANPHRMRFSGNDSAVSAKRDSGHQSLLPFGHSSTEILVRVSVGEKSQTELE